jgi:hypothetical protein
MDIQQGRLNDLHRFNLATSTWTQLTSPPVSPRGGAAIAYYNDHLFIHGGFDGKEHSELVVYDIPLDKWQIAVLNSVGTQNALPAPRSVHVLVPLSSVTDIGRVDLACLFGEGHPSDIGHDGAGNFFDDGFVFSININQKGDTVDVSSTRLNFSGDIPIPRGWFQAAPLSGNDILVCGGLNGDNARLADLYVLHVES